MVLTASRFTITLASLLALTLPVFAEDSPKGKLAEARKLWLKGNSAEAREIYAALAKDSKPAAPALVGVSRTWQAEGEYAKALEAINGGLKQEPKSAELLAAKAQILYSTGKWDEALASAEAANKAEKESFLARWVKSQILRDSGKLDEADEEMRWFVRTYTARSNNDDDIKDPDQLLLVGQAGLERARWHHLTEQFKFILNTIYVDALKFDENLWQAEYLAGMMLLEKYNRPEATKAFDNALKINPRAAEAFVGKGMVALQTLEIKDAEGFVEQALKINPHLTSALRLQADVFLLGGNLTASLKSLDDALAINPREEATLARKAAIHLMRKQKPEFQAVVAEVDKFDAKPGDFYRELATCLEDHKFYNDAEGYFRKAIELREKLPGPKSGLGTLYMRLGNEKEARKLLDEAFQADPFNVRVANMRKVLKHLEKYSTKETAHYILKFDPKHDPILAEFFAEYLEEVHKVLVKDFNYEPQGKILVELFNNHEMFSGRVVALPDLHTIGACTGRMMAMCSPTATALQHPFNWGRVVRHELVHIFNLAQTDFQVPHWLTEGLAVRNEQMARPPLWSRVLRDATDNNELLTLETIQLGFVRPRSANQWTLAYCQSQLYVDYLVKTYGVEAIGKMLNAFRDGLDNAGAIHKVCGIDKATFEKGYQKFLAGITDKIPPSRSKAEKALTLAELEKAVEKNPDDLDLSAKLAGEYLRRRQTAEARKLADKVLEEKKTHPLASVVKARLLEMVKEREMAIGLLEAAAKDNPDDTKVNAELARFYKESKELTKSAELYERCRTLDPLSSEYLTQLKTLYTELEKKDKLVDVLTEIAARDSDDLDARVELSKLLLEQKRPEEAETVARDALQISVLNEAARKVLIQALKDQKKNDEADKIAKRFEKEE